MQILLVEDETRLARLISQALEEEGHQVTALRDGREGFEVAAGSPFDLIVLDVMLPSMDGFVIAGKLRNAHTKTPILMLTGRDAPADVVKGLDSGADDYLTKPFSMDIFLARVRAVSRRGAIPGSVFLELDDLRLDTVTHEVIRAGRPLNLTPREYRLLELLLRNVGRVMARDTILQSVWGFDSEVSENNIEVFMRSLRLKVHTHEPRLIHTVRGFGYVMKVA
jgi:DNA-binding response OmpR family regulator